MLDDCWTRCVRAAGWSSTRSPRNRRRSWLQWHARLGGDLRKFQIYRGETARRIHGVATATAGGAMVGRQAAQHRKGRAMTVPLHRRRTGRRGPDHAAGFAHHRPEPRLPVRGQSGPGRVADAVPGRRRGDRHRATESRRDHRADHRFRRGRTRCGTPCIRATRPSSRRWPSRFDASTAAGVAYDIVPGVPAFTAAAAALAGN